MAQYYDKDIDYAKLMSESAAKGDYASAWQYEQMRNQKVTDQNAAGNTRYKTSNQYENWQTNPLYGGSAYEASKTDTYTPSVSIGNPSDFQYDVAKPTYESPYSGQIDSLLAEIMNTEDFAYNYANDPLYAQYAETYGREGNRAMNDTLAASSANTGGLASSYSVGAANQANNYYMSQLSDKIPELEQLAYQKYNDDYARSSNNLGLLQGQDDRMYGRNRDSVGDWYADRDFSYGQNMDQINRDITVDQNDYGRFTDQRDWDYGVGRDTIDDTRYTDETEYARGRDTTLDERYADETEYSRGQDSYLQAFNRWTQTGVVSAADAAILGVTAGTSTSDQSYKNAQLKADQADNARVVSDGNYDKALTRYQVMGYVTAEDAAILGLPAGTPWPSEADTSDTGTEGAGTQYDAGEEGVSLITQKPAPADPYADRNTTMPVATSPKAKAQQATSGYTSTAKAVTAEYDRQRASGAKSADQDALSNIIADALDAGTITTEEAMNLAKYYGIEI